MLDFTVSPIDPSYRIQNSSTSLRTEIIGSACASFDVTLLSRKLVKQGRQCTYYVTLRHFA